jgi:hypothetical protein
MSGYLENLSNGDENITPLTAGIGFNDGANKGFWRVQPRQKIGKGKGRWIEMGAELRGYFKDLFGKLGSVPGRALGSDGTPDGVRVLVQGQEALGLPDGIYRFKTNDVRVAEAIISDEYLESKGIDTAVPTDLDIDGLSSIADLERADITPDDIRMANDGINSPEGIELASYKESDEGKAIAQLEDAVVDNEAVDQMLDGAPDDNGGLGAWKTQTDEGDNGEILSSEVITPKNADGTFGRISANENGYMAADGEELFAYQGKNGAGIEANKAAALKAYRDGIARKSAPKESPEDFWEALKNIPFANPELERMSKLTDSDPKDAVNFSDSELQDVAEEFMNYARINPQRNPEDPFEPEEEQWFLPLERAVYQELRKRKLSPFRDMTPSDNQAPTPEDIADQLVRDAMDGKDIPNIGEVSDSVAPKKGGKKKAAVEEPKEVDLGEDFVGDVVTPDVDTSDFDRPVVAKDRVDAAEIEPGDFVTNPDTGELMRVDDVELNDKGITTFTGKDADGVDREFNAAPGQIVSRAEFGEPGDTPIEEPAAAPARVTPTPTNVVPKTATMPKNAKKATNENIEVGDTVWDKDGVEIGTVRKITGKGFTNFGDAYTEAEVIDSNGKISRKRFREDQKYSKVPKSDKPVAPAKPADPTKPADIPEPVVAPTPTPEPAAAPATPPTPPKGPKTAPAGKGPKRPDAPETPAIPDSPEKPAATNDQAQRLIELEDAGISDPALADEVAKVLGHKGPMSDLDGDAVADLISRVEASAASTPEAGTPEAPKRRGKRAKIVKQAERPEDAALPPIDRVDDGISDIDWPDDGLSPEAQAERLSRLRSDKVLPEFDQFGRPLFLSDSGNAFVLDSKGNPIPVTDEEAFRGLIYEFYPGARTTADGMRTVLRRFKDVNGDTVELSVSRANAGRSIVELRFTSPDGVVERYNHYDDRASFAGLHGLKNSPQMIMDILTGKKARKFGSFDSSTKGTARERFRYFRLQTRKTDREGRGSISTFATPQETWAAKAEGHGKVIVDTKNSQYLRLQQRELPSFWAALDEGVATGNFDNAYFRARKFAGSVALDLEALAELRTWLKSEIKDRYPQMSNRQAANLTNTVSKQMRNGVIETGNRRERPFMSADGNTTIEAGQWVKYTNSDGEESYGIVRRRNNSAIANPSQVDADFQYRDNVDVEFANGVVASNLSSKFLRVMDDPARRKRLKEAPKKYGPEVPPTGTLTEFIPGLTGEEMRSSRLAEVLSYKDVDPEEGDGPNIGSDGVSGADLDLPDEDGGNTEGGPVSELSDGDTFYGKDGSPLGIVISMQPITGKSGKPGFAILYVDEEGVDKIVNVAADEVRSPKA